LFWISVILPAVIPVRELYIPGIGDFLGDMFSIVIIITLSCNADADLDKGDDAFEVVEHDYVDLYEEEYDGEFLKDSLSGMESQGSEEVIVKEYKSDETQKDLKLSRKERINITDTKYRTSRKDHKDQNIKTESTIPPRPSIDLSECEEDPENGKCCLTKQIESKSIEKQPILSCTHRNIEKCHFTYSTQFRPTQQKVCQDTFQKKCSIKFHKKAINETVEKCYNPLVHVCGGDGEPGESEQKEEENCQTYFESSCVTRYVEKGPGKLVGKTSCEKIPVKLCGKG
jgi:hypothetical protein